MIDDLQEVIETHRDIETFFVEWKKCCVAVQEAITSLRDLTFDASEYSLRVGYDSVAEEAKKFIDELNYLDLDEIENQIYSVEPDFDNLGALGTKILDAEVVDRATTAWFRSGGTSQPSASSSVYLAEGRRYVELCNVNGTLAVYRVEASGRLKRLKQWPTRPTLTEGGVLSRVANNLTNGGISGGRIGGS